MKQILHSCRKRHLLQTGTAIILLAIATCSKAQVDPHFSQYYAYPVYLNPALTGAIEGDYRVTAIYRRQWSAFDGGFSTPGVSAEIKTNTSFNLGVNLMNQQAGGGIFNSLNGYATLAYTGLRLGKQGAQHITFGLSMGAINNYFNVSKFQTGAQWDAVAGYNPSISNEENLSKTSATVFDAGAGVLYYDGSPDKKARVFGGFSAYHLTQPPQSFIAEGSHEKLPVRYSVHGGVKLALSDQLSITPHVLYMRQGNAEEKMAGGYAELMVNPIADLLLGANYRFEDAVSPYLGLYYKDMLLGFTYDINMSDLGKAGAKANSFEISLSFQLHKKVKGDAEPFVCPRL